ncbi:MAG: hypothetical protein JSV91_06680 [Phycisphaerales bacterium]|nr:MAG: hypothetical protein JSV91_06680 [Phycisphaerales bacterium]
MSEAPPKKAWKTGKIKDARGRSVTQLDPVMMHLAHQHQAIPAEALRRIAQNVGIGMTRANRLALWLGIFCFTCFIIAMVILLVKLDNGTIGPGKLVARLLPYCGIGVAPYTFWMGTRRVRFGRIKKVMLGHLRCPHCGYDIRGLPVDPDDGATVCPECGCGWKLEPPEPQEEVTAGRGE